MTDKNKNKKSLQSDFLRYKRGEMSGAERNSFERELQKDPFAEEAAEGFTSISAEQASKDIEHLRKRIKTRSVPQQRFVFYRIAASAAVLMVISTLFIIIERNRSEKQLPESAVQSQPLEIIKQEPVTHPVAENLKPEETGRTTEKKEVRSTPLKERTETSRKSLVSDDEVIARKERNDSIQEVRATAVSIYLAEEKPAAPTAMAKRVESKEFNAKADPQFLGSTDTSISALNEVVVVGYGTRKDESENKDLFTGYSAPQPVNGKPAFDKYIRENIHRPDTATTGQRVVVFMSFLIRTDGKIDSIRIVRSPGKPFSDEAIRLLKSGPAWKPAEENGNKIEGEVRVRIVFK